MRWLFGGLLAASITILGLSPALAVGCGPGTFASVQIDLTGIAGTTCGPFGNGNPTLAVLPGPDPLELLGFTKLDSTKAGDNGPVPLSMTFSIPRFDGTVSFTTTTYAEYAIGFQLKPIAFLDPKPDWVTFYITGAASNTLLSGTFDSDTIFPPSSFEPFSDKIDYAVLYGTNCAVGTACDPPPSTPLPAALPLFAGGLGVFGLLARRRKKKAAVSAV